MKSNKKSLVTGIIDRGYLSYENPAHQNTFVEPMMDTFHPDSVIFPMSDDKTGKLIGHRCYFADGEEIYEYGGVNKMLGMLQPLFDKIGIQMVVNDCYECVNEQGVLTHYIRINNVKYRLFDNYPIDSMYAGGVATYRFAKMVNDQLTRQQANERLYLISGGNEGCMVFLTDEQYNYICQFATSRECNPLLPNARAKMFGLTA